MKYDYVAVVGDNNVGKTTFARALGAALQWKVGETSRCLDARLGAILGAFFESKEDEVIAEMNAEPERFRKAKRALGDQLCALDPACLVMECAAEKSRVFVGMRRPEEVAALIERLPSPRLLQVILYRSREAQPLSKFLAIPIATMEIYNIGSVHELEMQARQIADAVKGPQ